MKTFKWYQKAREQGVAIPSPARPIAGPRRWF
jgi:hypothetical protein